MSNNRSSLTPTEKIQKLAKYAEMNEETRRQGGESLFTPEERLKMYEESLIVTRGDPKED
ncbi:MAG: hypothetical protein COU81_02550 [Candidatus Portnoybacteria bacterium CG10_big_fil_rev_8_21_14_0_10_36_7]|uniref:Uncharacterized protein n=1 Tax=Candidatus Portnoybacteria bacterium CG10_big_fil_rev_8_21_14_0_10_36_7 TaxID=1974812 RepID=A0A2M8KDW0_9BACT|nr:MAG: hypothetical protein COU81_02550 [Candidatus Portnoybacteria bacterium CG10_big_fil_rev_8_21_14_0_10_36_7]